MKISRVIFPASLLLNLILLAAAGFVWRKPVPAAVPRMITNTIVHAEVTPEIPANPPTPVSEMKTNAPFNWNMVASADLETYVQNLRGIGCPEQTIRDIITAEVDELFLKKLAERLDPMKRDFWIILANWKTQKEEIEEKLDGVEKISDERDEMLEKLLGGEKGSTAEVRPPSEQFQERINFLPPEKQEQMVALTKKYNDERMKIQKEENGKPLTPEQQKAIENLRKKTDADRKALMTQEEFEEYQLRGGNYGSFRLNAAMPEFGEEQVRAFAKMRLDFDQAHPASPENDPSYQSKEIARKELLEQQEKIFLGEERYADYQRALDNSFQQLYRVTERYDLPRDSAVKVYDLQQAATKQAVEIRNDPSLSDDERDELLSVLQNEAQRSVTKTLGNNAAKTYEEYGGHWLKDLADD